jgi:hypothetical protein
MHHIAKDYEASLLGIFIVFSVVVVMLVMLVMMVKPAG